MNEAGAFWGLMIGLIIGVIRMVMDFSYPEPLCMEHDTRPSIVANVHYMYFAAFLFWVTGIVALIISLMTSPDEEYKAIRTTFVTRKSRQLRPDEDTIPEDNIELEALHSTTQTTTTGPIIKNQINDLNKPDNGDPTPDIEDGASINSTSTMESSPKLTIFKRIRMILLGMLGLKKNSNNSCIDKNSWEVQQQIDLERISHLEQTFWEKIVLYINLVIILLGAIGLYVYFSINPFTSEDIVNLRSNLNISISHYTKEDL
jgi:uncharacterized membrane protein